MRFALPLALRAKVRVECLADFACLAGQLCRDRSALGAVLLVSSVLGSLPAMASPELLRVCTQRYAAWVNTCDTTLRAKPVAGVTTVNEGEWCAPSPKTVTDLKTRLFAIDQTCEALAPEEKMRVAALVGQTLRMLGRVAACPVSTPPKSPLVVAAPEPSAAKVVQTPIAVAPATTRVSVQRAVATPEPSPQRIKPVEPIKAPAAKPQDTPRVTVAIVPPRAQRTEPRPVPSVPPTLVTPPPQPTSLARSETRLIVTQDASADATTSDGDCLFVRQTQPGSYVVDTSRCGARPVQAAVEFYQANGSFECVRQTIVRDVAIVGVEARTPEINFQCIAGSPGCSAEILAEMFPECRNG